MGKHYERKEHCEESHALVIQYMPSFIAGGWMRGNSNTNCKCSPKFSHGSTVNILCLDSGLRKATAWGYRECPEWVKSWVEQLTWAQPVKDSIASGSGVWQSLPRTEARAMLIVCVENLHHNYLPPRYLWPQYSSPTETASTEIAKPISFDLAVYNHASLLICVW